MKRFISTALILVLLITALGAVTAAASANGRYSNLRVNHEDIEMLVRRGNPTVRNNEITVQGLNDVVSDNTINQLMAAQQHLSDMQRHTQGVLNSIMQASPDTTDAVTLGVMESLRNDLRANQMDIMQISAQMEQLQSAPVRGNVGRAVMQINHATRQITWGVESLFLGYHALLRQLEQTRESLHSLDRNIEILERRYAVGHITARSVQNVRNTRTQLEAAVISMENELVNLSGQMNLLLGRSFDAPVQVGALPTADRDFLSTVDKDRDVRLATMNNHLINIALSEMEEYRSQSGASSQRSFAIAENNHSSEVRAVQQRHESLVRAIIDREVTLELAQEQLELLQQALEETERRFERGMVSRFDLEQAQTEVTLQEIRVSSADADLFSTIRRYQWLVRGLNI